ncbi:MAG: c-type cytochrome domain-containing protein [Verrucomicrobiota bacterium]
MISVSGEAMETPNYLDQVLPIFRNACLNCHNSDKKKAGLDLSTYQGSLQGSENGKVLKSGDSNGSLLLKCVMQSEDPKMPPKGEKLSDSEIALIKRWIDGQLLEAPGGKVVAAVTNSVGVAVVALTRPEGRPPMPVGLPLEAVVHTDKSNSLTALGVSPWAPLVALGGQKQIVLFHTETFEMLGVLPFPEGFPTIIRFSRNGQLLLTGGGRGGKSGGVVIWKVETGERIAVLGNESDQVLAADLSPDQRFVALGGPGKLVKIYATKDGRLIHSMKRHTDWVTALAYSSDGKLLASGDRSGGVILWEAESGKEHHLLAGHKGGVTGLSMMGEVLVSGSEDATIKLWDVKEGKEMKSWSGHKGGVQSVSLSVEGRIVSSGRDKVVRVWDQGGKQLMGSEAFGEMALRAEMTGDRVVGGDWSGEVRVWTMDGKRVGQLSANPPTLSERVAGAEKALSEAKEVVEGFQKRLDQLEGQRKEAAVRQVAKLQEAERLAAERRGVERVKLEVRKASAMVAVEATRGEVGQLEKRLAELRVSVLRLREDRDVASSAGEDARHALSLKQESNVGVAEIEQAKKEVAKRAEARDLAQKRMEVVQAEVTQAELLMEVAGREQKGKIAAAEKSLSGMVEELAALKDSPQVIVGEEEDPVIVAGIHQAKVGWETGQASLVSIQKDLEKWRLAELRQRVVRSRELVVEKQAAYERALVAVREVPLLVERSREALAVARKRLGAFPGLVKEKEQLLREAKELWVEKQGVADEARARLELKEVALKALLSNGGKAGGLTQTLAPVPKDLPAGDREALAKKLADLTAEMAKRREIRGMKTVGSSEYAEADGRVQALKPELAAVQGALEVGKSGGVKLLAIDAQVERAEVAKAKESLREALAAVKPSAAQVMRAEKVLEGLRREVEGATELAAKLAMEVPVMQKNAPEMRAEAERLVKVVAKEVEAAKREELKWRLAGEGERGKDK